MTAKEPSQSCHSTMACEKVWKRLCLIQSLHIKFMLLNVRFSKWILWKQNIAKRSDTFTLHYILSGELNIFNTFSSIVVKQIQKANIMSSRAQEKWYNNQSWKYRLEGYSNWASIALFFLLSNIDFYFSLSICSSDTSHIINDIIVSIGFNIWKFSSNMKYHNCCWRVCSNELDDYDVIG